MYCNQRLARKISGDQKAYDQPGTTDETCVHLCLRARCDESSPDCELCALLLFSLWHGRVIRWHLKAVNSKLSVCHSQVPIESTIASWASCLGGFEEELKVLLESIEGSFPRVEISDKASKLSHSLDCLRLRLANVSNALKYSSDCFV